MLWYIFKCYKYNSTFISVIMVIKKPNGDNMILVELVGKCPMDKVFHPPID